MRESKDRAVAAAAGKSNGSFLRAGLIDEISLAVCPAVDGARGGPYAFDSREDETGASSAPFDDAGEL